MTKTNDNATVDELRAAVKAGELEAWINDPTNRRKYLAPLARRILAENPAWSLHRILMETKHRGCNKQIAAPVDGYMRIVPNPDYIEPTE